MDSRSEEMNEIEQAQTENKNSRKDAKKRNIQVKHCPTNFNEILRKFFDKLKAAKGQALFQLTGIRASINIAI